MKFGTTFQKVHDYQVATPVYQGPLDLLLQLIEGAELDITKLALAQVTDQYLSHLSSLETYEADEISGFLVIASKLLQIKSEALLPRPPVREVGEEDPGELLARQLIVYKRFKEIAGGLKKREMAGLRTYLRMAPPPHIDTRIDLSAYTISDILKAARAAFLDTPIKKELGTVVAAPRITIREKISAIVSLLRPGSQTSFYTLLGKRRSRLDIVVTFLAMLELVKRHYLVTRQDTLFGDITLETSEGWRGDIDFELEFGE